MKSILATKTALLIKIMSPPSPSPSQNSQETVFILRDSMVKKLKVHYCRFENLPVSSSLYENNILRISHENTFYFLRNVHGRYVKSLFTNIQKQQNMQLAYFIRIYKLQGQIRRIFGIKKAKLSEYCLYMNTNIQRDFQICISVLLNVFLLTRKLTHNCLVKVDHLVQRKSDACMIM